MAPDTSEGISEPDALYERRECVGIPVKSWMTRAPSLSQGDAFTGLASHLHNLSSSLSGFFITMLSDSRAVIEVKGYVGNVERRCNLILA
jgi:hypothetical protein